MKKIIKLLIPPIFLKMLTFFRKKQEDNITYEGIFTSFAEVDEQYKNATNYNNDESLKDVLNEAKNKFDLLKEGKIPSLDWSNCRHNLLPTFLSSFSKNEKITILDIGGGLGGSFIDLKFSCPHLQLDYFVYDLPDVIAMGKELHHEFSEELHFIDNFKNISPRLVLFGSSLQYFEDYSKIIDEVTQLDPEYILMTDHPMGDVKTFVCAQVNMKDRVIPRYVFEIKEIVELMKKNNYEFIHKSVNYYHFHNFDNYQGNYQNCQHYNLAFRSVNNS